MSSAADPQAGGGRSFVCSRPQSAQNQMMALSPHGSCPLAEFLRRSLTSAAKRPTGARTAAVGLLVLRNADRGPLFDSFVHLLGGEQRPDRHASEPRRIGTQLCGCCSDFIGVIDNRVGGCRAVIEKPKFELAADRLDKLGNTCFEGRGRLLL
jgi:hypothetical protein